MKIGRRLVSFLIILTNLALLCGCWNYQDIEKLMLVTGFAIDKNEKGDKYLVTVEVVDFEMAGTQAKQVSKFVESEGDTVFDAVRNIIDIIGKKMYWAHANVVIISQDIAREGIIPVIDLIIRDTEIREELYVTISKEKTAKEILKQEMLLLQTSANYIENMLTNQKGVAHAHAVKAYELVGRLEAEGGSITMPVLHLIDNSGKKTAELDGTAIFKSDKLVGFLNTTETKYFLFIIDNLDRGLITLKEEPASQMDNITLEIYKSKTKVKPEFTDKSLTMNIQIKTDVAIGEIEIPENFTKKEKTEKLKKDAEKKVKSSVEDLIKKVQNDFDTDIFGFGITTKANLPSVWRSAQQEGKNLFKDIKPNVKVKITIKNSALTSKAIKKGA